MNNYQIFLQSWLFKGTPHLLRFMLTIFSMILTTCTDSVKQRSETLCPVKSLSIKMQSASVMNSKTEKKHVLWIWKSILKNPRHTEIMMQNDSGNMRFTKHNSITFWFWHLSKSNYIGLCSWRTIKIPYPCEASSLTSARFNLETPRLVDSYIRCLKNKKL